MPMIFACPTLTPPSIRNPCSAKSVGASVVIVTTNEASALFQCKGGYRYLKVDVETKERPRKTPVFLKCDSGGHHSTKRE